MLQSTKDRLTEIIGNAYDSRIISARPDFIYYFTRAIINLLQQESVWQTFTSDCLPERSRTIWIRKADKIVLSYYFLYREETGWESVWGNKAMSEEALIKYEYQFLYIPA